MKADVRADEIREKVFDLLDFYFRIYYKTPFLENYGQSSFILHQKMEQLKKTFMEE